MAKTTNVRNLSQEDREEIASTLWLSTEAATILWGEVDQIVEEIQQHQHASQQRAQGRDRRQIKKYLGALAKQLERLDQNLAGLDPNTAQVIRRLLGGPLAELLSHRGFAELLDEPMSYEISRRAQMSRDWTAHSGPARAIETDLQERRANIAAQRAPELLNRLFMALRRPISRYLEIERSNPGGAPSKIYRNHVIARLAAVYGRLWDGDPKSTPAGKFVLLCELVLAAIGLETEGIDKAVGRILKKL